MQMVSTGRAYKEPRDWWSSLRQLTVAWWFRLTRERQTAQSPQTGKRWRTGLLFLDDLPVFRTGPLGIALLPSEHRLGCVAFGCLEA